MKEQLLKAKPSPNFFIVGAARSGTTSLMDYLNQHPQIYMSPVKEPSFFIANYGLDNYREYLSLFKKAGSAPAIGEASTGYLFDHGAAEAIYQRFKEAKIIILLRNPVEMAFSSWRYMQINGSESNSFEDAIDSQERERRKKEPYRRLCAGWWGCYLHLERALYFEQVRKYMDVFGKSQVKVYIFERFFREPEKSCQNTFRFLGVDSDFVPKCRPHNEGGKIRFHFIRQIKNFLYPLSERYLSFKIRDRIGNLVRKINVKKDANEQMDENTREYLKEYFRGNIAKLESLLGHPIDEWRL